MGDEPSTQTSTTAPATSATQPATTPVTTPVTADGKYGDVNNDGNVNVKDATEIQKHIAKLSTIASDRIVLADVDQNNVINIKDATAIQKYTAHLDHGTKAGEPYTKGGGVTPATQAPVTQPATEAPTEAPTQEVVENGTRVYLDNGANWDTPYIYFWTGSSGPNQWPGVPMEKDGEGRWTYLIPSDYDMCIFSNNGGNQTGDLNVPSSSGQTYSNTNNSWQ